MDPLSIIASSIAILQFTGATGKVLQHLLTLRDAPQQLQQLWNESEALKALLLETERYLTRKRNRPGEDHASIERSITPVLETVAIYIDEFDSLVRVKLAHVGVVGDKGLPKVKKLRWLRADSDLQNIKVKIQQSRAILKGHLDLLSLNDTDSVRSQTLQIQHVALTSQESILTLQTHQQKTQLDVQSLKQYTQQGFEETRAVISEGLFQMHMEQRQGLVALQADFATTMQPLLSQMTVGLKGQPTGLQKTSRMTTVNKSCTHSSVRISATINTERCPRACRCRCHASGVINTPQWLKSVIGQMFWSYNTSMAIRACDYGPCRKSLGKQQFTYYFPAWTVSRALVVSADLDDLFGPGGKLMVNVPLIVPEENHIVWSVVLAGNLEQLRGMVSENKSLMHIRNQWGQSLMHVAAKVHQPGIFNFLLSMGMNEHLPDENCKTAATTVLTRRGSEEYELRIDEDDIADRLDWTPLHKAAALTRHGGKQFTESLLRESEYSDVNARDALGRTPLHWLAENGDAGAIRLLTQDPWSADVGTRDLLGFTPLHCACWADSVGSAEALLDAGGDANAQDKHWRTPLMHFDDVQLLDLMLERRADLFVCDDEGANLMHHVAVSNQDVLLETLLEQSGDALFVQNRSGDTPLGLAVQNNSVEAVGTLLSRLAVIPAEKVGLVNHSQRNLLHMSALYATTEMMDMLSAAVLTGLDPDARDKDGHTPNECFVKCRDESCAVTRADFQIENSAWKRLMRRARGQPEIREWDAEVDDDVKTVVGSEYEGKAGSLFPVYHLGSESDSDSDSQSDEFVDADEYIVMA